MLNESIKTRPMIPGNLMCMMHPTMRAYDLPEIKSLPIRDLFPELPEAIFLYGGDLSVVRERTERALAGVDMSMIKPNHTVNILCSEHGFNVLGGDAYTEMIKATRDVIQERTGCPHVRLRYTSGFCKNESPEAILHEYGLYEHFEGQILGTSLFQEGIPLETEIGTLYVVKDAFDSDWFIHTHYDDPRELYFNRLTARIYKPFTMSYARIEVRSLYHLNFGPRSANIVPRLIFEALKHKHAFTIELTTSPTGLLDVSADNDIKRLERKGTINTLKSYGKLLSLMSTIEDVIMVHDFPRPIWYGHCGGVVAGIVYKSHMDNFDLDVVPKVTETLSNPAVKAVVINHTSGYYNATLPHYYPIFVADELAKFSQTDDVLPYAKICDGLPDAMDKAREAGKTDNVMVFDGTYGHMNLSESMADFLMSKVPAARELNDKRLPKWLKQRGIDPAEFNN